jgi:cytochrome c oxidase cbb3-type subunit 3
MRGGERRYRPAAGHWAEHTGGVMERLAGRACRVARYVVASFAALSLALPMLAGCGRDGQAAQRPNTAAPVAPARAMASDEPSQSQQATAPTLAPALIAHPGNIQAGLPAQHPLRVVTNPREHDPRAIEEGKQLFVSYNCADCHGGEGSGGMGPSLQDGRWHFGGSAGEVYESISEGRPDGMPSWGGRIDDSQIWALVAYVRTLSSGKDVTTQIFEGAGTVERGGH